MLKTDIQDTYDYISQFLDCSDKEKTEIQSRLMQLVKNSILNHNAEIKEATVKAISSINFSNVFPL